MNGERGPPGDSGAGFFCVRVAGIAATRRDPPGATGRRIVNPLAQCSYSVFDALVSQENQALRRKSARWAFPERPMKSVHDYTQITHKTKKDLGANP